MPLMHVSGWIDQRFHKPIEEVIERIEAQEHRRFLKSHLPLDGLPFYGEVKYIHVARDGRDAAMSYHNHITGFAEEMLNSLDKAGLGDESVGRPYPRPHADPARHFHRWISETVVPGDADGSPVMSFFWFERTWWDARHRPNVLLVHYNDLKTDLAGEMLRVADFLAIPVPPGIWPTLVQAARFETMRREGDALMASMASIFKEGSRRFFYMGSNDRWKGVVNGKDLALYDAKFETMFSPACAGWIEAGRLKAGDPRSL